MHTEYILAAIPTIISAIITRNLMWVVIVGMAAMALIRSLI